MDDQGESAQFAKWMVLSGMVRDRTFPFFFVRALILQSADVLLWTMPGSGYILLHLAVEAGASLDVIRRLVETRPESVRVKSFNDRGSPICSRCTWRSNATNRNDPTERAPVVETAKTMMLPTLSEALTFKRSSIYWNSTPSRSKFQRPPGTCPFTWPSNLWIYHPNPFQGMGAAEVLIEKWPAALGVPAGLFVQLPLHHLVRLAGLTPSWWQWSWRRVPTRSGRRTFTAGPLSTLPPPTRIFLSPCSGTSSSRTPLAFESGTFAASCRSIARFSRC